MAYKIFPMTYGVGHLVYKVGKSSTKQVYANNLQVQLLLQDMQCFAYLVAFVPIATYRVIVAK